MKKIQKAIISVYYKEGLEQIVQLLHKNNVELYSTGGTAKFIEELNIPCIKIEDTTQFPEILEGRVKTLHPAVFGGLLARNDIKSHSEDMTKHKLPFFDLMICNLYPFEEYIANKATDDELIEKIDIGGVTLIRAAAKNFKEVVCISKQKQYEKLYSILSNSKCTTTYEERKSFATEAFVLIQEYDKAIANYFLGIETMPLRYGENPHQKGYFEGNFNQMFEKLHGKEISYNNILDIDAAVKTMSDFMEEPTFGVFKHNNSCGLATRPTLKEAYLGALAGDTKSAFGGVLIGNREIDASTATEINPLFCEIVIAPSYSAEALDMLKSKKNRIVLIQKIPRHSEIKVRTVLNGNLIQDEDNHTETHKNWTIATKLAPSPAQIKDLEFGVKAVKHLKSNAIALVKDQQLIGMGCGQTSRVDALEHAVKKAKEFGFDTQGAIMASDAFFPFADCVEIADKAGIVSVIQPGGSIKDNDSIEYCDNHGLSMVVTGIRHFNH